MPVNAFFPPRGLRGATLRAFERDAKRVCAQCPVVQRCLAYALESNEPFGIWGGMTSSERYRRTAEDDRPDEPVEVVKQAHRIGPPTRPYKRLFRANVP